MFFFCLYLYERNLKKNIKHESTKIISKKHGTLWHQEFD